jgi:hypothetical protein
MKKRAAMLLRRIAREIEEPPQRTPEELDLIATMERWAGRKLGEAEIYIGLEQARHIGEL